MPNHKDTTLEECAEALRKAGGFVSRAAEMLGITHSALSQRITRHKVLQEVREEVTERYLDMAEHALIKKVKGGDLGAMCFYLKCKGKKRGYIERAEVNMQFENKIPLVIQGPDNS